MMEEKVTESRESNQEIESFINSWSGDVQPMRDWFQHFYTELRGMENVSLTFLARPGVSYSMRPKHGRQTDRELFAMVDVIDDDPSQRWLSVCFYEDMITDPKGHGEIIPGGLSGSDGYCFDMFEDDDQLARYIMDRLREATVATG